MNQFLWICLLLLSLVNVGRGVCTINQNICSATPPDPFCDSNTHPHTLQDCIIIEGSLKVADCGA